MAQSNEGVRRPTVHAALAMAFIVAGFLAFGWTREERVTPACRRGYP